MYLDIMLHYITVTQQAIASYRQIDGFRDLKYSKKRNATHILGILNNISEGFHLQSDRKPELLVLFVVLFLWGHCQLHHTPGCFPHLDKT